MQMKTGFLLLFIFFGFFGNSHAADDYKPLCDALSKKWADMPKQGDLALAEMIEFTKILDLRVCPTLSGIALRAIIESLEGSRQEKEEEIKKLQGQVEADSASDARLAYLEIELRKQNNVIRTLQQMLADLKGRYEPEPSSMGVIFCEVNSDIASLDQGNVRGLKFENVTVPPRSSFYYDIGWVEEGYSYLYEKDLASGRWVRNKIAVERSGAKISFGAMWENEDSTVNYSTRFEFDPASLIIKGMLYAEGNIDRSVKFNANSGRASIHFGNAFSRPPRMWVESVGRCTYRDSLPNLDLASGSSFRLKSRSMPDIPKIDR
jgi:hypothetical protein